MSIKLVSFDTDDTLYDFMTISTYALEKVAEFIRDTASVDHNQLNAIDVIAALESAAEEMEHPYAHIPELRRRAFAKIISRFSLRDERLVSIMEQIYVRHRFAPVTLFDGVLATLEELRRTYTLCIISNGEQDLADLGVADYFTFVLTATDVGFQKPDPRIFQEAMLRAGCAPHEMAHVGDSVRSDVTGAKAAGAWAIWYNPDERANRHSIIPDREIRSLLDLPSLLNDLT